MSQPPLLQPMRQPTDQSLVLSLLALVAAWLTMTWPWLLGFVTIPWDSKAHFAPQIQFLASSLARGESPFWTPFVFSGHPQIADPQSMIFSPPYLILAAFTSSPSLRAIDTTELATMLAGGAALLLYFRDRQWHWAGGLVAAIAFVWGASMAWRVQHIGQVLSLSYLAMALLLLHRALWRRSLVYGVLSGIIAAFMVLGRDQVALLGVYFLVGYVCWWTASRPAPIEAAKASALPLLAGAVAGLVLIIGPITLTLLLAEGSNRPVISYRDAAAGSLHPALLMTFLVPQLYGAAGHMADFWGPPSFTWRDTGLFIAQNMGQLYLGALPLLFLSAALLRGRLLDREIVFFALAFVIALLYALGWYTPFFQLAHLLLPGVDLYRRPADATFLVGALGAILAGYAVHLTFTGNLRRNALADTAMVVLLGLAMLAGLVIGARLERLPSATVQLLIASGTIVASGALLWWAMDSASRKPAIIATALVTLLTMDLTINNGPSSSSALPASYYDVLEPETKDETIALLKRLVERGKSDIRRDRIELAGLGFHWPNASLTHRLENTLGYNPVRLAHYSRATGAEDHVGLPDQRKFSPLFPSYRSLMADLLGLRFIASGAPIEVIDPRLAPGDLKLVGQTTHGYVYENPRALPRVLLATRCKRADFEKLLQTGDWPDFDPQRTVLLETSPGCTEARTRRSGTARILSYTNTRIVVESVAPDGGWLVLNDIWHPWWNASIDGNTAEILRANVIFRAVAVPPGSSRVEFVFRPFSGAWRQIANRRQRP